jgi:hypothetical protein
MLTPGASQFYTDFLPRRNEPFMFRFAIRDLLWLTVAVSLGLGWWCWQQRAIVKARRQEKAQSELVKAILELHHFERAVATNNPNNPLVAVAINRCSAAAQDLSARVESYSAGESSVDAAAESIRRFAASGLSQDRAKRLAIAIELSKLLEENVQMRYDSHNEPLQALLEVKGTRRALEMELVAIKDAKP